MTHGSAPKGRKIGRNQTCPCGNGRKYKHCHGSPLLQQAEQAHPPYDIAQIRAEWEARERVRQTQQGLGRPIISAKVGDQQVVAVGNKIHSSSTWKTFPDFLSDYLKQKLDPAWGNAEIAKPLGQRHPVCSGTTTYVASSVSRSKPRAFQRACRLPACSLATMVSPTGFIFWTTM
ncbi:SEC-C metal-binding domain-containing protein [Sphingopyxis sp.]|uniref:SEC-C metal-binding domain-containing protein n=1 Tax=Sphingopyxis sp. TaxID=1908224 RepID=UPI003D11CC46